MPLYLSLLSDWHIMSLSGSCLSLFSPSSSFLVCPHVPRCLLTRFFHWPRLTGISCSNRHNCSSEYSISRLGQASASALGRWRSQKLGSPSKIRDLRQDVDIDDLRKTLITDIAFQGKLDGVASSDLKVYNNDEDATNQREPIEEDTPLSELIEAGKGGRKKTALIVVAPPKPGK
ncbi:hypothetical protein BDF19DRAFT_296533 [Syncephalis fuscata]|nr:hypothetical protein BDF19DRAFT_296533 [Syncephalis fuscata]